jgi:hypothetical protein
MLVALALTVPASALAAGRPGATTRAATDVSPTAATLQGSVNPNGLVTTWYFQYGKTTRYGTRTQALDAGSGTRAIRVSSTITNLTPNTTYHYRIVATNSAGNRVGADRTFKTPEHPTVSTIASSASPVTFGKPIVVSGFLLGPRGGAGKRVALEGNAFPYTAGFTQLGNTVVTGADSGYQFVITPLLNVQLRVVDRSDPSIVSPTFQQEVAMRVRLRASKRGPRKRARFSGSISPARQASVVVIQRRTKRGGWTNVASVLPRTKQGAQSSTFSRKLRVSLGVYRAVARPNGGAYAGGISGRKRVSRG